MLCLNGHNNDNHARICWKCGADRFQTDFGLGRNVHRFTVKTTGKKSRLSLCRVYEEWEYPALAPQWWLLFIPFDVLILGLVGASFRVAEHWDSMNGGPVGPRGFHWWGLASNIAAGVQFIFLIASFVGLGFSWRKLQLLLGGSGRSIFLWILFAFICVFVFMLALIPGSNASETTHVVFLLVIVSRVLMVTGYEVTLVYMWYFLGLEKSR